MSHHALFRPVTSRPSAFGLAMASLLTLTACMGGGGGGAAGGSSVITGGSTSSFASDGSTDSGTVTLPVLPPPSSGGATYAPEDFETSEYFLSTGLSSLNASHAYAAGATGQGVTVAVVDTGIDLQHADFAGAIHAASTDIISGRNALDDVAGHGTLVAGTIGARKNGVQVHGLAYNSQILAIRADTVIGSCQACFTDADVASATNHARNNGARVINYSLSGPEAVSQTLLDSFRAAAAADIVLVAAAGNNYGQPIDYPAALVNDAQIAGRLLAVGAVDSNNQIASFSARPSAGGAEYFVVAPGVSVLTLSNGGYMQSVNGTSFSSGYVSGAAALLRSYAPYLTAQQVVQILLGSATDLGAPGVDAVYGAGLINLEAALAPSGTASVPTGATVFTGGASFTGSTVRLGTAFGDSLKHSPALSQGIFIDSYGRAFSADYSAQVSTASGFASLNFITQEQSRPVQFMQAGLAPALALSSQRGQYGVQVEQDKPFHFTSDDVPGVRATITQGYGLEAGFGFAQQAGAAGQVGSVSQGASSGFLGLMGAGPAGNIETRLNEDVTLRTGFAVRDAQDDPMNLDPMNQSGGRVAFLSEIGMAVQTSDKLRAGEVGLRFGALKESESALDSRSTGAFTLGEGASTNFVGTYAHLPVRKDMAIFATYETGWTKFEGQSAASLLQNMSVVRSESFSMGVTMTNALTENDRLTLSLSQPLRVVDAAADLILPVGVDSLGNVQRAASRLSLAPAGRQLDAELGYALGLSDKESLNFKALVSRQPGHDASAGPAGLVGVRYEKKF